MPMDAICLSAALGEITKAAQGGKVDKIYQPARYEVVLALRGAGGGGKLLLSANPSAPRAQMTAAVRENPAVPPMFCMLLRKHLTGARLLEVTQPPVERVARFEFEGYGELGDKERKTLVLEAIGRQANLILLDGEGRILDCLRRVEGDLGAKRPVLPGLFYQPPPTQDKINPLSLAAQEVQALLEAAPPERKAADWLLDTFNGLSPLVARELAFRACGDVDARLGENPQSLGAQLIALIEKVKAKTFTPHLLLREGRPADFSFLPILQYGEGATLSAAKDFGSMLDEFYVARERGEQLAARGKELRRTVTTARERLARKRLSQAQELAETEGRGRWRELGDILMANLGAMERGMARLTAVDLYDPAGREISIPLDPLKTPQQNAANHYKRYNKAKTAARVLEEQLAAGAAELDYLDSVLDALDRAERADDLQEIRRELEAGGYLRKRKEIKGKQEKQGKFNPIVRYTSGNLRVQIGKNNVQNDHLTFKMAQKSDLWLHVQMQQGAHVVLATEGQIPDETSITEAAILAAYHSRARGGGPVAVDYTLVKNVKKRPGGKPGMVIYEKYKTAYVTPDEGVVHSLRGE